MEEKQQRKARVTLFMLVGMGVFSILMLVLANIQNVEAKKQRELAIDLKEQLVEMEKIANQHQKEAMVQRTIAEERERMAQKALEDCQQNQRRK